MKRYYSDSDDLVEAIAGDWVKFDDAQTIIAMLVKPLDALSTAIAGAKAITKTADPRYPIAPPGCPNHPDQPPASPEHSPLCAECLLG